jgi:hypothetical protein
LVRREGLLPPLPGASTGEPLLVPFLGARSERIHFNHRQAFKTLPAPDVEPDHVLAIGLADLPVDTMASNMPPASTPSPLPSRRAGVVLTSSFGRKLPHGIIAAGLDGNPEARTQVLSVQTAARRLDLSAFDRVIVDEAQHSVSESWARVLAQRPKAVTPRTSGMCEYNRFPGGGRQNVKNRAGAFSVSAR